MRWIGLDGSGTASQRRLFAENSDAAIADAFLEQHVGRVAELKIPSFAPLHLSVGSIARGLTVTSHRVDARAIANHGIQRSRTVKSMHNASVCNSNLVC